MHKNGKVLKRGVFDLEVRREPPAFCRGCGESMEVQSKHACSQLFSSKRRLPMKRTLRVHTLSVWHNLASAAPAASFSPATLFTTYLTAELTPANRGRPCAVPCRKAIQ